MRRLQQFIRKRTDKRHTEHPKDDPPFPWLASSTAHDPTSWIPTRQTQGFFMLPYDIRHQIFKEAFGARVIHIDLRLRPPSHNLESSGGRGPRHGGYPPLIMWSELPKYPPPNRSMDLAWRWYHCVCHRDPPGPALLERVSKDECLEGQACCEGDEWTFDACQLGAMGLLLSCKQAHDELQVILYRSNTIFMESMPLIEAICSERSPGPYRLLGPGVAALTSLQLRVDLTLFSSQRRVDRSKEANDRSRLDLLLKGVATRLPHLVKLEIIFDDNLYLADAPCSNMEAVEKHLLRPLLAASKQMESLNMTVSIPDTVYDAIRQGLERQHKDAGHETTWEMRNLWMLYPFEKNWADGFSSRGYWIKVGVVSDRGWRTDGSLYSHAFLMCTRTSAT